MTTMLALLVPILVIVGAFMWLKPSKRDQYLAKLRSEAIGFGFRMGSLRVPDLTEFGRVNERYEIVTLYQKSLIVGKETHATLTVVRTTGQSGAYLPNGWQWEHRSGISDKQYQAFSELLESLPISVSVIDIDRATLGLSWDERDEDISFNQLLETIAKVASIFDLKIV